MTSPNLLESGHRAPAQVDVKANVARVLLDALSTQCKSYCILAGYEGLPHSFDTDIDFMVSQEDFDRMPMIIEEVAHKTGTRLFQVIDHELTGRAYFLGSIDGPALTIAVPILRMFDIAKAKAFYADLLGFQVDWEHRFEPGFPLYMQVSRDGVRLHLSEHNGDGTPGQVVFVDITDIDAFHAELQAKGSHAPIEPGPSPNMRVLNLWDPFGGRLRFAESRARADGDLPAGYAAPSG